MPSAIVTTVEITSDPFILTAFSILTANGGKFTKRCGVGICSSPRVAKPS